MIAHDAKALRRGARQPRARHRGRRLPARPRAARLPARASWPRSAGSAPTSTTPRPPPTRCSSHALAALQREQLEERGLERLLHEVELPLVQRAARDGASQGSSSTRERLARDLRRACKDEVARARARDLRPGRRGVHDRLAAAARRGPVREARAVAQAARQDRLLDRRARAAGDPRRARDHPQDRALARADQARPDLPRRAAGAGRRATAASTRRSTRPRPPPAGSRRPTPTCRTSRSAPSSGREIRACFVAEPGNVLISRRLLPGRAAGARARRRRARAQGDLPARRGRAHGDRVAGPRRRAGGARRRHALEGRRWSTSGSSTGSSAYGLADRLQIPQEEAQEFIDTLPGALPGRARRSSPRRSRRRRAGLRVDAVRPPPPDPRAARAQPPGALAGRAARGQHARSRGRRRTSSRSRWCARTTRCATPA